MVRNAFPFDDGVGVVSHACQICLRAYRPRCVHVADRRRSMKDTCPTPRWHMRALPRADEPMCTAACGRGSGIGGLRSSHQMISRVTRRRWPRRYCPLLCTIPTVPGVCAGQAQNPAMFVAHGERSRRRTRGPMRYASH